MINLDKISEELFNKIRGRFPSITIGDEDGNITNEPNLARFFDFDYQENNKKIGKISISLSEDDGLLIIYSQDFIKNQDSLTQKNWYQFLREMRQFSKKRMLKFDVRDITKTNLTKRDYKFLAAKRSGEENMNESKLYGTGRISYQNIDSARIVIKHNESIDQSNPSSRTRNIKSIYIESSDSERFKYPYRHLSGARAMARHVAEGGNPYDNFGSYITTLSEEMWKLRKFKNYVNRSNVMAESLSKYVDIVQDRVSTIRKTIEGLQKRKNYLETIDTFETPIFEEVPDDIKENWIDELTIRQFNEELQDVFPYIYNLVKEGTKAKLLGPDDLLGESSNDCDETCPKSCPDCGGTGDPEKYKKDKKVDEDYDESENSSGVKETESNYEQQLENYFDEIVGKYSNPCNECGKLSWRTLGMTEEEISEGERHGNSKIYDKCWKGWSKVPGKKRGEAGSCKRENMENFNEATVEHGRLFIKFREKKTPGSGNFGAESYLIAFADFVNDPKDLKLATSLRKFTALNSKNDIANAIKKLMNDKVFVSAKKIILYRDFKGLENKFPHLKEFYDWMEGSYTGDKIIIFEPPESDEKKPNDKVTVKRKKTKKDPVSYASSDREYNIPAQKMTRYFTIDNSRLMLFFRQQMPDFLNKFYKSNMNMFVMKDKDFRNFMNYLQSAKIIDNYGPTQVQVDKERSFAESMSDSKKVPITEFILSYFDRKTGQFPKGETAVLTMVEKDYGEEYIEPAKQFIESINNKVAEIMGFRPQPEIQELDDITRLAGL